MRTIQIKNGRIIDPSQSIDRVIDLWLRKGKVLAIGAAPEGVQPDVIIDAGGLIVAPGLIDCARASARAGKRGRRDDRHRRRERSPAASLRSPACPIPARRSTPKRRPSSWSPRRERRGRRTFIPSAR